MWVTLIITEKYNFRWLEREKEKKKKPHNWGPLISFPCLLALQEITVSWASVFLCKMKEYPERFWKSNETVYEKIFFIRQKYIQY